jgi:hypothetical protein
MRDLKRNFVVINLFTGKIIEEESHKDLYKFCKFIRRGGKSTYESKYAWFEYNSLLSGEKPSEEEMFYLISDYDKDLIRKYKTELYDQHIY